MFIERLKGNAVVFLVAEHCVCLKVANFGGSYCQPFLRYFVTFAIRALQTLNDLSALTNEFSLIHSFYQSSGKFGDPQLIEVHTLSNRQREQVVRT